ncbi:MAG: hypothetical protein AAFU53_17590 [Cyanobacteria bacterium J06632_3]
MVSKYTEITVGYGGRLRGFIKSRWVDLRNCEAIGEKIMGFV